MNTESIVFIEGRSIYLRPLMPEDYNRNYLSWLNDPEVSYFTGRRFWPTRYEELQSFDSGKENQLLHLAVCMQDDDVHVGNVSLGPIHWFHRCAEMRILIGQKEYWSRGIGIESIYLMARHAFQVLGLHRIEAGSINPSFNSIVTKKLGWNEEGRLRSKFFLGGEYVDIVLTSQLSDEFQLLPNYEIKSRTATQ